MVHGCGAGLERKRAQHLGRPAPTVAPERNSGGYIVRHAEGSELCGKGSGRLNGDQGLFRAIVFTSTARENGEARGAHHHGIASLERAISDVISSRAVRSTRTARRITGRILGVAGEQLPQRPQGQHRFAEHRVEGV